MEFRSWDELSEVEQLQSTFSDYYKSVYGFRPRFMADAEWNCAEWLKSQLVILDKEAEVVFAEEKRQKEDAIRRFEAKIAEVVATGAKDRETAIRWMFDAENDDYVSNDPDYFCFLHGLPYGYFKKSA